MAVVVLLLHALPGGELESAPWWAMWRLDAMLHAAMFALLTGVILTSVAKGQSRSAVPTGKLFLSNVCWILGACDVYGVALEWAQSRVFSGRGADWTDVLADVLGVGIGSFVFWALYLRCSSRNN